MRLGRRWLGITGIALAAFVPAAEAVAEKAGPDAASGVAVKAALLFNFARFIDWPGLESRSPLVLCVVGDLRIGDALVKIVGDETIAGHRVEVRQPVAGVPWRGCHVLFIADSETRRFAPQLDESRGTAMLTVSDREGFARTGGIVELFIEDGKMRFAVNLDATARSGLQLSSRLLRLAKVTRDDQHR